VRRLAGAMLDRRGQMIERAARLPGRSYTRVAIGPAVEAAIAGLEWNFWQMSGISECLNLPGPGASDDDLFAFLDKVSSIAEYDDERVEFFEPYVYQSYAELGYPDASVSYLAASLQYTDADYVGELPTDEPRYDTGDAMRDIDHWVEHEGDRLLFIYGEWDPWFAGRFVLGDATHSAAFVLRQGTHKTQIRALDPLKRDPALAMIRDWTGVEPVVSPVQRRAGGATLAAAGDAGFPEPHMSPLLVRALAARR
jgi:hypothetical protein